MRLVLALLGAIAACAPASLAAQAAGAELEGQLRTLRAQDVRVETIGHRLATANRDLCGAPVWRAGLVLHDRSFYGGPFHLVAIRLFQLADRPAVLALAADGPAARAGLRLDDQILALDGQVLSQPDANERHSERSVERLWAALEAAFADGAAEILVERDGARMPIRVAAERGCPTRFQQVVGSGRSMESNGTYVSMTSTMVAYAADDNELAAAMAHEFAHNLLEHRRQRNQAGVRGGLLGHFGRNARIRRGFEVEADRLSVHLLDRAGYDVDAAARFWQRFGPASLGLDSPTHPSWRSRVAALAEEAGRIRAARTAGRPLAPPIPARDRR